MSASLKVHVASMRKTLTMEERCAVARRLFEALCEHYPDRYIALVEQPGNANPTTKLNWDLGSSTK
jgi:hypothetical protein